MSLIRKALETLSLLKAYLNQFRPDVASFLEARAEEILPGYFMFIAHLAHNSGDIKEQGRLGACTLHLGAAFEELVNEV